MSPEGGAPIQPAGRPDFGDLLLRLISFVAGGGLAYALFLSSARTAPDEAALLWTSVVGSVGALALYGWHVRGRRGRSLRWYATLGLAAVGAVLAHLILGTVSSVGNAGAMVFAVGASVGLGVPHGLLLGTSAALMIYGLRGPAPRPVGDAFASPDPAATGGAPQGGEPPPSEAPPSTSSRRSRIVSGSLGAALFLAPFVAFLAVEELAPLALWAAPVAVCAAAAIAWIWMDRTGRPLGSRPVPLQAAAVVVSACAVGWSLLLLIASPLAGISLALVYALAAALLLRALGVRSVAREGQVGED